MKRKFTFLTAALALLAFLAIPFGMRGQSDHSTDYTGNITLSTTGGSNASTCGIIISGTTYDGIKAGTSSKTGVVMITVPAGTKYLHMHAAAWNNTTCSLAVTPTGYSDDIALTANSGIANNSPFTFSGDPSTADYYKVITFADALEEDTDLTFTAVGGKRFVIWGVTSEEEGSGTSVATPTFNPANGTTFGDEGLEVTISCTTENTTIYYTLDGNDPDDESTEYTGAISLTTTTTIKAVAYDGNDNNSAVATATYTYVDPNGPGTVNNPYTVAQARAAIDAGAGTQGVYATGIVSAIPTAYNSQYSNITFNFVDNQGDEDFLQAFRCVGDEAANVVVGDVVVVFGNLTKYGSTYEFGQGCQLVSLTHPVITDPSITVATYELNVEAGAQEGTINVTYANVDLEMTEVVMCDANGGAAEYDWIPVCWLNEDHNIIYQINANEGEARTAYLKVCLLEEGTLTPLFCSDLVTINQAAYVAPSVATLPFAFNGGRADIENTDGLAQEGLGTDYNANNNPTTKLKFDNTGDWLLLYFNEEPGTLTFDIKGNGFSGGTFTVQTSEDGETYTDLAAYTELGDVDTKTFENLGENVRYIKWIYTEKSSGNVGLGNINLYEFGGGPVLVPSVTVTPNVITAPAEGANGTLAITYENIPDLISFDYYFCDANGGELEDTDPNYPDWIDAEIQVENEVYSVAYTINANEDEARTAYFKVYTTDTPGNEEVYAIVTVNQAAYVAPPTEYAELPFEFNGGRADIENTDGLTQEGLGTDYNANNNPTTKLKFDNTGDWLLLYFNEEPGTLTFDIKGNSFSGGTFTVQTSEDGVTYTDLAAYTELGDTETKTINNLGENVRYIKWIYTEKSSGNVGLGDIHLYEVGGGPVIPASITVAPATMNLDAEQHYIANESAFTITYQSIAVTNYESFTIHYYDAEGQEIQLGDEPWLVLSVIGSNDGGYQMAGYVSANEGEARSTYFKVSAQDANDNTVYSNLVTVNQAEYVTGATYSQATYIESGRHYIITNGIDKAMGMQNNNNRAAVDVTINEGVAEVESADVVELVINGPDANGFYTIYDATEPGYLYAASSSANHLKTETHLDANNNGLWSIEFGTEGDVTIKAQGNNSRNWMRYNSSSNIFSCYSSGQQNIYLYVKDEEVPTYTFYKDIKGYNGADGGYYFIATPVDDINPADVPGMTEGLFDLYWFDQTETEAWRNYKDQTTGNFNLACCMGYLYANNSDVTLAFSGTPTSNHSIALVKDDSADFPGYNLVGNPFGQVAYINKPFYTLNEDGSEVISDTIGAINPMEGVFVVADTDGENLTFSTTQSSNSNDRVVMNVYGSRANVIDRAIVRFDENSTLPKFQLNPNSTKLYIPQDDIDYAVIYSQANGEIPVSFKAATNGTYTLNVNTTNIEMDYLHLIDNLTGEDVDLLANPSYSFEAKTSDYAQRFRLVFGTDSVNENNAETFAFFNGSEWQISNVGEATLQVVDVMGRVLKSETVNGNASVNVNAVPGVYMFRLINGENVRVQKVVVK